MCVASHAPPTGDLARNPGLCPEWESNQRPFGLQASTQSTEQHQPGPGSDFQGVSGWDVSLLLSNKAQLSEALGVGVRGALQMTSSHLPDLEMHIGEGGWLPGPRAEGSGSTLVPSPLSSLLLTAFVTFAPLQRKH